MLVGESKDERLSVSSFMSRCTSRKGVPCIAQVHRTADDAIAVRKAR